MAGPGERIQEVAGGLWNRAKESDVLNFISENRTGLTLAEWESGIRDSVQAYALARPEARNEIILNAIEQSLNGNPEPLQSIMDNPIVQTYANVTNGTVSDVMEAAPHISNLLTLARVDLDQIRNNITTPEDEAIVARLEGTYEQISAALLSENPQEAFRAIDAANREFALETLVPLALREEGTAAALVQLSGITLTEEQQQLLDAAQTIHQNIHRDSIGLTPGDHNMVYQEHYTPEQGQQLLSITNTIATTLLDPELDPRDRATALSEQLSIHNLDEVNTLLNVAIPSLPEDQRMVVQSAIEGQLDGMSLEQVSAASNIFTKLLEDVENIQDPEKKAELTEIYAQLLEAAKQSGEATEIHDQITEKRAELDALEAELRAGGNIVGYDAKYQEWQNGEITQAELEAFMANGELIIPEDRRAKYEELEVALIGLQGQYDALDTFDDIMQDPERMMLVVEHATGSDVLSQAEITSLMSIAGVENGQDMLADIVPLLPAIDDLMTAFEDAPDAIRMGMDDLIAALRNPEALADPNKIIALVGYAAPVLADHPAAMEFINEMLDKELTAEQIAALGADVPEGATLADVVASYLPAGGELVVNILRDLDDLPPEELERVRDMIVDGLASGKPLTEYLQEQRHELACLACAWRDAPLDRISELEAELLENAEGMTLAEYKGYLEEQIMRQEDDSSASSSEEIEALQAELDKFAEIDELDEVYVERQKMAQQAAWDASGLGEDSFMGMIFQFVMQISPELGAALGGLMGVSQEEMSLITGRPLNDNDTTLAQGEGAEPAAVLAEEQGVEPEKPGLF